MGAILLRGAGLVDAYYEPWQTRDQILANNGNWFATGDLGEVDADGYLFIRGRSKEVISVGGMKFFPQEVETVLKTHPAVQEAVVMAREDREPAGRGEKRLVAYVVQNGTGVKRPDEAADAATLRRYVQEKLPHYMIPTAFVLLEALPLTPNGKVDRKALPPPEGENLGQAGGYVHPRTQQEHQLAKIWEETLAIYPIGIRDNFFELGGHSLLAMQLMARIQQAFDQQLPLNLLFQHPTVETFAAYLEQPVHENSWTSLVTLQAKGNKPPFFCVPGIGGNPLYLHTLARHLGSDQPFYGLQAMGLDGVTAPHPTIEAAVAHYLAEIQRVQPHGPYHLGGHSLGGLVAFEMAQQLLRAGESIGLLASFDTVAPGQLHCQAQTTDPVQAVLGIADFVGEMTGHSHTLTAALLQPLAEADRLRLLQKTMEALHFLPEGSHLSQVRGMWRLFTTQAGSGYQPQAVRPLPITLFVAMQNPHSDDAAAAQQALIAGWAAYGPLTVKEVPGTHHSILTEPHVQVLAQELAAALAECNDCLVGA